MNFFFVLLDRNTPSTTNGKGYVAQIDSLHERWTSNEKCLVKVIDIVKVFQSIQYSTSNVFRYSDNLRCGTVDKFNILVFTFSFRFVLLRRFGNFTWWLYPWSVFTNFSYLICWLLITLVFLLALFSNRCVLLSSGAISFHHIRFPSSICCIISLWIWAHLDEFKVAGRGLGFIGLLVRH